MTAQWLGEGRQQKSKRVGYISSILIVAIAVSGVLDGPSEPIVYVALAVVSVAAINWFVRWRYTEFPEEAIR